MQNTYTKKNWKKPGKNTTRIKACRVLAHLPTGENVRLGSEVNKPTMRAMFYATHAKEHCHEFDSIFEFDTWRELRRMNLFTELQHPLHLLEANAAFPALDWRVDFFITWNPSSKWRYVETKGH